MLSEFRRNGDAGFFWAGCVAAVPMSLFNLMLLPHIIGACLKWWPKKASDPLDKEALARTSSLGRRDSAKAAADVGRRMSTHVSRRVSARFSSIKED